VSIASTAATRATLHSCCCHKRLSSFSAHFVKQNENEHQATTLIEKDHKNTVKPERSG